MHQITKRLLPGQDLRVEIGKVISEHQIKAGVIVSAVGSLEPVVLRMAGAKEVKTWEGEFEIVSITGTVSVNGHHIHLSASDKDGAVVGGHLKPGCIVRTTVELVMLAFDDVEYKRVPDPKSGYDELVIE
jgi:predicted DNA-binding protein with PD1-like motif